MTAPRISYPTAARGRDTTRTNVSLFATDPWDGFDRSQLHAQCDMLNESLVDGVFARGLDLLSADNAHGVCFEALSVLGFLAASARRGTLGTCITDLADVDSGTIAHAVCTLLRLNPSVDVCLGIGVRHNAPNQTDRLARLPDRLSALFSSVDRLRGVVPFDVSRFSVGLVGTRVAERMRTHACDLFRRCASVYVPVGALSQWREEPGLACHGFAAVALTNEPNLADDVGYAAWRVHEDRFADHMQRVMDGGRFGMLIHTISWHRNRAAWGAALGRLQRFGIPHGDVPGHESQEGAHERPGVTAQ